MSGTITLDSTFLSDSANWLTDFQVMTTAVSVGTLSNSVPVVVNGTTSVSHGTIVVTGGTTVISPTVQWSDTSAWIGGNSPGLDDIALVAPSSPLSTAPVVLGGNTYELASSHYTIEAAAQTFGKVTLDDPNATLLLTDNATGTNPSSNLGSVGTAGTPGTILVNAGTLAFGPLSEFDSGSSAATDEVFGSQAGTVVIGASAVMTYDGIETTQGSPGLNRVEFRPQLIIGGTLNLFSQVTLEPDFLNRNTSDPNVNGAMTIAQTGTVNIGSHASGDTGGSSLIIQQTDSRNVVFNGTTVVENNSDAGMLYSAGTISIENSGFLDVYNIGTFAGTAGSIWLDGTSTLEINQPYNGGPDGPVVHAPSLTTTSKGVVNANPVIETSTIENITAGGTIDFNDLDPLGFDLGAPTGLAAGDTFAAAQLGSTDTLEILDTTTGNTLAEIPIAGLNASIVAGINNNIVLDGADFAGGSGFDGAGLPNQNFGLVFWFSGPTPCFAPGTRILTERGEVPVEALRAGDRVATLRGEMRPVVWTGQRRVEIANHPRPWDMLPVRIAAGAFGPGRPHRDLIVSPDHALFDAASGCLVPARYLLNGATIRQEQAVAITWHHVELDAHDVLFAEGLPAESYLDTGNRGAFEGATAMQLHPDFARRVWEEQGCAPLLAAGPALAAARAALLDRATLLGARLTEDADLHVVLTGGRLLRPALLEDGVHRFVLPPRTGWLRLVSRAAVPAEVLAEAADPRRLGVAVNGVLLDGAVPAEAVFGAGWYEPEAELRWTDGDASLHAGDAAELRVRVMPVGLRYWAQPAPGSLSEAA